jgi:multidrug efflux pump subunit AcrA (membrane-fusion protein)
MMEEIVVNHAPGGPVWGEITYISELADSQTLTTRVELTIDNSEQAVRSGQIVRVRLTRRVLREVIMIPLEAVIPTEQGRFVYLAEGGRAAQRRRMSSSRAAMPSARASPRC